MNNLERLQAWYQSRCDGVWEHEQGVSIESTDNPGWLVKISVRGTPLDHKPFTTVIRNVPPPFVDQATGKVKPPFSAAEPTSSEWLCCFLQDATFTGAGDAARLDEILSIFLDWAETSQTGF